jgi:hypothetical protein
VFQCGFTDFATVEDGQYIAGLHALTDVGRDLANDPGGSRHDVGKGILVDRYLTDQFDSFSQYPRSGDAHPDTGGLDDFGRQTDAAVLLVACVFVVPVVIVTTFVFVVLNMIAMIVACVVVMPFVSGLSLGRQHGFE